VTEDMHKLTRDQVIERVPPQLPRDAAPRTRPPVARLPCLPRSVARPSVGAPLHPIDDLLKRSSARPLGALSRTRVGWHLTLLGRPNG